MPLEQATRDQLAAMLETVPVDGKDKLLRSMRTIQRLLRDGDEPQAAFVIRDPRPGDIGWIIHRHGVLYAEEYGWDESFEGLVAEIAGRFIQRFDPKLEHCWIAERDGEIVGSVFVVRKSARVAQLRLLYVEPSTRGLGIGRRLVDECIAFAKAKGYRTMTLWTNAVLHSARKIYQAAGFKLVKEARHHSFGKDLVGQHWDLRL
jgi:GNAT superfamily N-acetyltransferase